MAIAQALHWSRSIIQTADHSRQVMYKNVNAKQSTRWAKIKDSNTKITISQKFANIFVLNSAHLFRTQLDKNVLCLLDIRQIDGNANFMNEICKCTVGW